jgi:hypothetical protein
MVRHTANCCTSYPANSLLTLWLMLSLSTNIVQILIIHNAPQGYCSVFVMCLFNYLTHGLLTCIVMFATCVYLCCLVYKCVVLCISVLTCVYLCCLLFCVHSSCYCSLFTLLFIVLVTLFIVLVTLFIVLVIVHFLP